jgi:hypothetical protein
MCAARRKWNMAASDRRHWKANSDEEYLQQKAKTYQDNLHINMV